MEKMVNVYQFNYKGLCDKDCVILFGDVNQEKVNRLYKKEFSYKLKDRKYKGLHDEQITEEIFVLFNMDNRPNGKVNRSISVGDIVEIDGIAYVCASFGFEKRDLDLSQVQDGDNYKIY